MKVYTSKLGVKALNWAVESCEIKRKQQAGERVENYVLEKLSQGLYHPPYSMDEELAYPIIIREKIQRNRDSAQSYTWAAWTPALSRKDAKAFGYGSTEIQAAMRCYVSSIMGEVVDVPERLITRTIHEIVLWDGQIIASVLREQDIGIMFDYFQVEYVTPDGHWTMASRWKEVTDFRYAVQCNR